MKSGINETCKTWTKPKKEDLIPFRVQRGERMERIKRKKPKKGKEK